jgi:hypothetical protein
MGMSGWTVEGGTPLGNIAKGTKSSSVLIPIAVPFLQCQ